MRLFPKKIYYESEEENQIEAIHKTKCPFSESFLDSSFNFLNTRKVKNAMVGSYSCRYCIFFAGAQSNKKGNFVLCKREKSDDRKLDKLEARDSARRFVEMMI